MHYLLVFFVFFLLPFSKGRLPLGIGSGSDQKVVLVVVLDPEAQLADGDIIAGGTLVARLVYELPLAADTLECSVIAGHPSSQSRYPSLHRSYSLFLQLLYPTRNFFLLIPMIVLILF